MHIVYCRLFLPPPFTMSTYLYWDVSPMGSFGIRFHMKSDLKTSRMKSDPKTFRQNTSPGQGSVEVGQQIGEISQ